MISIFEKYFFTIEKKKLEEGLVDEILKLSSLPKSNDLKIILERLSKSRNKIISKNFLEIIKQIDKGSSPRDTFETLKQRYNSEILNRFLDLIYLATTTGTISFQDYRTVANNFIKTKQILDERSSNLLMQKYTILFASSLIVPGILGIVISLIKSLISSISQVSTTLYQVTYWCVIIYILEYIVISSFYLSILDENKKRFIIYLLILLPVSLLIFFLSSLM